MYTLQGLIRRGINNTTVQWERLGYVSNSMSNLNTNAYKSVRFEQTLDENGYLDGVVRQDHKTGSTMITKRPLDVALTGPGYIPVTSQNGDVKYTRDGSFTVNNEGYLVTNDGYLVGDGIKIPANYDRVRIRENGNVVVLGESKDTEDVIGRIPLVQFPNAEGLKSTDYNKFIATEASGQPMLVKDHKFISQGNLERSNTDYIGGVNEILRLNTSFIAGTRLIKIIDEMYQKAINVNQ